MIPRMWILLIGAVGTILWTGPLFSADGTGACDAQRSRWMETHEFLKETMGACQRIKEAPLGSRIQRELTSRQADSIAYGVQAVLKERSAALSAAMQRCREAAGMEAHAFEDWRRCARTVRPRKGEPPVASPDSVAGTRKQVLSALQDLLLDEAYVQYKNFRQPEPPAYSLYQQPGWGPGAATGNSYRGYGNYR